MMHRCILVHYNCNLAYTQYIVNCVLHEHIRASVKLLLGFVHCAIGDRRILILKLKSLPSLQTIRDFAKFTKFFLIKHFWSLTPKIVELGICKGLVLVVTMILIIHVSFSTVILYDKERRLTSACKKIEIS